MLFKNSKGFLPKDFFGCFQSLFSSYKDILGCVGHRAKSKMSVYTLYIPRLFFVRFVAQCSDLQGALTSGWIVGSQDSKIRLLIIKLFCVLISRCLNKDLLNFLKSLTNKVTENGNYISWRTKWISTPDYLQQNTSITVSQLIKSSLY